MLKSMYAEKLSSCSSLFFQDLKYDYLPHWDRVKTRNGHNWSSPTIATDNRK